jgi:PPOX class probable F420-dependent enzyme
MVTGPEALGDDGLSFLAERHLATLTTLRPDGSPHVVAVGFTWDPDAGLARVITFAGSRKARNLLGAGSGSRAAVSQVDGGRWLTMEGPATVTDDPARVAEAVRRYAERYRQPGERADRVAIEIQVDRVLGRWST